MRKTAILVPVLLFVFSSCASPGRQPSQDRILLLMELSGLNTQLEQTPRVLREAFGRERAQDAEVRDLPQARFNEIDRKMAIAFDPAVLREDLRSRLKAGLAPGEIEEIIAWLRSPLARKVTALEEEASRPEFYQERKEMIASSNAGAERILRIRRLDAAVKGTDSALNAAITTQTAILAALMSDFPPEKRPTVKEIQALLVRLSPDWRQSAERQTLLYFLDTYRTLTDEELDRYILFAVSASGQRYHEVVRDAIFAALTESSQALASKL